MTMGTRERNMLYVVSFHGEGAGGFDWFYYQEEAETSYQWHVDNLGDCNVVRLVKINVTDLLDEQLAYLEADGPALREHVPMVAG